MSITGALMGFAVVAIIVGFFGTIVMAIQWGESLGKWRPYVGVKIGFGLFLALFFVGGIIVGGLG